MAAVKLADEHGIQMRLRPDGSYYDDQAAAKERLIRFYGKFGFVQGADGYMIRSPNPDNDVQEKFSR